MKILTKQLIHVRNCGILFLTICILMQMFIDLNISHIYHFRRKGNVSNAMTTTKKMTVHYFDTYHNKVKRLLLYTINDKLKTNISIHFFTKQFLVEDPTNGVLYQLPKEDHLLSNYFVKSEWPDFNISNIVEYTLTLYLALCDVSQSKHLTDKHKLKYYMILGSHCFISEANSNNADIATELLKHTLMKSAFLCKVNKKTANILFMMDDLSSHLSSMGTELQNIIHYFVKDDHQKLEWEMLMEKIDGRIGQIVSFLREHCDNYKRDAGKSLIHRALQSAAVLKIIPHKECTSITAIITVEGGYTGYIKILQPAVMDTIETNHYTQGAGEILGHWVDRIVGWYRSPVVVTRTLYLTQLNCSMWQPNGYDCKYQNITSIMLPGMSDHNSKITDIYRQVIFYDIKKKKHFIIVCIVGKFKEGKVSNEFTFPDKSKYRIMNEYFNHELSYNELIDKGVYISKQRISDITDLHIVDFININTDRPNLLNWVLSGTRFIFIDNGVSFRSSTHFGNNSFHCIPLFCQQSKVANLKQNKTICRFNKDTITKLEKVGPKAKQAMRLGVQLQFLIKNNIELQFMIKSNNKLLISIGQMVNLNLTTEQSINSRISYVLHIHSKCYEKYGKSIYI